MSSKLLVAALLMAGSTVTPAQNAARAADAAPAAGATEHTERTVRFKQIDRNGDGKLSLEEFQNRPNNADVLAGRPTPPPDAKALADRAARFKQGDKNGDGFLTFEEFVSLESLPIPGSTTSPADRAAQASKAGGAK